MSKVTSNQIIFAGFVFGIIIFVLLNIFFPVDEICSFSISCNLEGFPFTFYKSGYEDREGGDYVGEIIWFGLLANILLTIIFGFILGLIFRFIWVDTTAKLDSDWNKGT